jgi:hypothetical protein
MAQLKTYFPAFVLNPNYRFSKAPNIVTYLDYLDEANRTITIALPVVDASGNTLGVLYFTINVEVNDQSIFAQFNIDNAKLNTSATKLFKLKTGAESLNFASASQSDVFVKLLEELTGFKLNTLTNNQGIQKLTIKKVVFPKN